MLGTKYNVYRHSATETTLIRATSYSLPRILHDHVTVVTPSTYFSLQRPQFKTSFVQSIEEYPSELVGKTIDAVINTGLKTTKLPVDPTCDEKITLSCLNAMYNISYTPASTTNNTLGVVGYLNEFANHQDLKVGVHVIR